MKKTSIRNIYNQHSVAIQQTSYTCGPCAILNVLRLRGNTSYDEPTLEKWCDAKPEIGTSNESMIAVAQKVGLQVIEEESNAAITDIERQLDEGSLVIVNYIYPFDGDGHYAVVAEHDKQALYLYDSTLGLVRIPKKSFIKWWFNSDRTIPQWYMAVA